jgi:hypothetical protein
LDIGHSTNQLPTEIVEERKKLAGSPCDSFPAKQIVSGGFMPLSTRFSKSGEKNVVHKRRSNVSGRLNRAARNVSTGQAADLTPGVVTELHDRAAIRASKKKAKAIIENRRRR